MTTLNLRSPGLAWALCLLGCTAAPVEELAQPVKPSLRPVELPTEVVATGIPGAGAIMQVGTFQQGGPLRDSATWIPYTAPGAVLHHDRVLVASTSNFGAPLSAAGGPEGSVVSLDVSSGAVAVPAGFAAAGGQASGAGGRVILYTANSPAFVNGLNNPAAATAALPGASAPLGISFNNGFGRPWVANAPGGSGGDGTITVLDGNGRPLAGAPSPVAGGVFAGTATNRTPGVGQGLGAGALATGLLTKSPDGTGRAVFLAALADGSVAQVHVQKGVDGLVPPGTFTPIPGITAAAASSNDPDAITRVGMVFNWAPTRNIFITDPLADRILVLDLADDGTLFSATTRAFSSRFLDRPVDLAPTVVEVATRNFASNTTMGVGSDLYVLNRGDNSIVRMGQDGEVTAVRTLEPAGVPGFRAAGIAVSPDARTIWVSGTTVGGGGVVLRAPAFGQGEVTEALLAAAPSGSETAQGSALFSASLDESTGLGPHFNDRSCVACHGAPVAGGMGTTPASFVTRFEKASSEEGEVSRAQSIDSCGKPPGVPSSAGVVSVRSAMTLRGTSLMDFIAERDLRAAAAAQPEAVRGRLNVLADGRVGRFGWKAHSATLVEFMGEALRDEMGLTNTIAPKDLLPGCSSDDDEADGTAPTMLIAFLNGIDPAQPDGACLSSAGATVFAATGCATCHTPSFNGPGRPIRLYSDLLLHDMGEGLADGIRQGSATGSEFRTMPLWKLSERSHFLHDGRAATPAAAIDAHGGQAGAAAAAYRALSASDQAALLAFLGCI